MTSGPHDEAPTEGLGWPEQAAFDPDGPGPLPTPDGTEVADQDDVSRETVPGTPSGLGWAPAVGAGPESRRAAS